MDLIVQRIVQSDKVIYLGSMSVEDLLADHCVIDTWDPGKLDDLGSQGYQREVDEGHVAGIQRWLEVDPKPFLPTGALLSARESEQGKLSFDAVAEVDAVQFGTLSLPPGRQLYIVDYQHRWNALRRAIDKGRQGLLSYRVPVTILADVSRYEEMIQFYVINSKQKRIDTDLALAILHTLTTQADQAQLVTLVGRDKKYRIRAIGLTYQLALKTKGPWAGAIQLPHDLHQSGAVLSTKAFADSLQPILSSRSPVANLADTKLLRVIEDYWSALSGFMPEAFAAPKEYSIQKTPGVFSLHIVAAKTVLKICAKNKDYSLASMNKYLAAANLPTNADPQAYLTSDFWRARGPVKQYSGSGGHRALATLIRAKVEAQFPVI